MGIGDVIKDRAFKQMTSQMEDSTKKLQQEFRRIIKNQNEQTLALITIYEAQKEIAKKMGVTLPNPKINMNAEMED